MPKLAVTCGICKQAKIIEGGHKAFNCCGLRQPITKENIITIGMDMKKQKKTFIGKKPDKVVTIGNPKKTDEEEKKLMFELEE